MGRQDLTVSPQRGSARVAGGNDCRQQRWQQRDRTAAHWRALARAKLRVCRRCRMRADATHRAC